MQNLNLNRINTNDLVLSTISQQESTMTLLNSQNPKNKFTKEEDELLLKLAIQYKEKNWQKVSEHFENKNYIQCFSRYKRIRPGLKRGPWTKEEDDLIIKLYNQYGKKWSKIAKIIKDRNGKQIRDRYINVIDPKMNKTIFTTDEDEKIRFYYKIYGTQWSKIAAEIQTNRSPDIIKNRFYCHLKNKSFITNSNANTDNSFLMKKTESKSCLSSGDNIGTTNSSNENSKTESELDLKSDEGLKKDFGDCGKLNSKDVHINEIDWNKFGQLQNKEHNELIDIDEDKKDYRNLFSENINNEILDSFDNDFIGNMNSMDNKLLGINEDENILF